MAPSAITHALSPSLIHTADLPSTPGPSLPQWKAKSLTTAMLSLQTTSDALFSDAMTSVLPCPSVQAPSSRPYPVFTRTPPSSESLQHAALSLGNHLKDDHASPSSPSITPTPNPHPKTSLASHLSSLLLSHPSPHLPMLCSLTALPLSLPRIPSSPPPPSLLQSALPCLRKQLPSTAPLGLPSVL